MSTLPCHMGNACIRASCELDCVIGSPKSGARTRAPGIEQTVGGNADEGNRQSGNNTAPGISLGQCDENLLAKVTGADHGADDDHGQRHQNGLIDAQA